MTRRHPQRGETNVGCLVWLVILVIVGMILWKVVPVKIANATLYDYMEEMTRFPPDRKVENFERVLTKRIVGKAKELGLPVTEKQVFVKRSGKRIIVRCTYTVPLEFPGYTYHWKVEHEIDRPIFYL